MALKERDELEERVAEASLTLRGFIDAFCDCVDDGYTRKFAVACRIFYDELLQSGFTGDDAIRILSHSFTRMISEGG